MVLLISKAFDDVFVNLLRHVVEITGTKSIMKSQIEVASSHLIFIIVAHLVHT